MKRRAAGAKQAAISSSGRTTDKACVDAHHCHAGFQEFIDARKPAPAETNDAGIGVYLAGENGIRRAGVSIPDGRSRAQK